MSSFFFYRDGVIVATTERREHRRQREQHARQPVDLLHGKVPRRLEVVGVDRHEPLLENLVPAWVFVDRRH